MLWPFHSLGNLFVVVNVCLLIEALVLGFLVHLLYLCIVLHLTLFCTRRLRIFVFMVPA